VILTTQSEAILKRTSETKTDAWRSLKPVDNYLNSVWADELVLMIDFQSMFFAIKLAITDENRH
jgi:hypothetical protein